MQTRMLKPAEVTRDWIVIDADGKPFGRIITEVATKLRGKHKPTFTPNVDGGDFVVVINASLATFSGNKIDAKEYHRHTGYFGGVKSEKLADLLENNPAKLYKLATRGMLPKNNTARNMLKRLKVYTTAEHPHTAQVKGDK
jgi:large subunit ribosomal protein L13